MSFFLLIYFALYGSMQGYALWRARAVFGFGSRSTWLLGTWMALMLFAPLLVRLAEKAGWESLAKALAWVGYLWLGLLFVYLSASWTLDFWRALAALCRAGTGGRLTVWAPGVTASFWTAAAFALGANTWGFAEALHIRTAHLELHSAKVPKALGRFRIVQLSDIHLGLLVREDRLMRILRAASDAHPDLLVCTGDLVDGEMSHLDGLSRLLSDFSAPAGKFAILGNHEFYAGAAQAEAFLGRAGFTLLRNGRADVGEWLEVAGVDDPAGAQISGGALPDEAPLLSGADPYRFLLLLKHRPVVAVIPPGAQGRFDLQLSGHTHGGQIFPFHALVRLFHALPSGRTDLPEGGTVFVTRGAGTWGPPVRFLAPPEITIVDLYPLPAG